MDKWQSNLQTRKKHAWSHAFTRDERDISTQELRFLLASCDAGVIRNGGRLGARHAPASLMHHFKNLVVHANPHHCIEKVVTSPTPLAQRLHDFDRGQQDQYRAIAQQLSKRAIHLGGGHDHVYPFALAIAEHYDHIHILNIDAHLDTRQDPAHHSGTPFRQLSHQLKDKMSLTQIGIRSSANVDDNYRDLPMQIVTMDDVDQGALEQLSFPKQEKCALLLSIDCDGIDSSLLPAVSAPNPYGLRRAHLNTIKNLVKNYWTTHDHLYLGCYEFNPLYDDSSSTSARFLAHYLHELIA